MLYQSNALKKYFIYSPVTDSMQTSPLQIFDFFP